MNQSAKAEVVRQLCANPTCQREFSKLARNLRKRYCTDECRYFHDLERQKEARKARRAVQGAA